MAEATISIVVKIEKLRLKRFEDRLRAGLFRNQKPRRISIFWNPPGERPRVMSGQASMHKTRDGRMYRQRIRLRRRIHGEEWFSFITACSGRTT